MAERPEVTPRESAHGVRDDGETLIFSSALAIARRWNIFLKALSNPRSAYPFADPTSSPDATEGNSTFARLGLESSLFVFFDMATL